MNTLTLIAALLLASSPVLHAADTVAVKKPNIVFILVDDMGIGDCSAYNPKSKIQTPNIDRLSPSGRSQREKFLP
jgi:hypothetical protein